MKAAVCSNRVNRFPQALAVQAIWALVTLPVTIGSFIASGARCLVRIQLHDFTLLVGERPRKSGLPQAKQWGT